MPRISSDPKSKLKRRQDDENDLNDSETENFSTVISDEEVEKAQDRLKEAKKYLANLTRDAKKSKKQKTDNGEDEDSEDDEGALPFGEIDAEEIDREIIASRLQRDTLVSRGRAFENIAESYKTVEISKIHCNTPDGKVPTGCAFGSDSTVVYLITKGNCVYQYAVNPEQETLQKIHTFKGIGQASDIDSYCSVAVSNCGTFLVAGSHSGKIVVWSVKPTENTSNNKNKKNSSFTYKQVSVLNQHRGAVLGLTFSRDDSTFYSCSADRTIKIWSLESGEALYIDTLFGHQDIVPSVSSLGKEICVSVGTRDRTARLWKVAEETQLVFRGPETSGGSQDIISMIDGGSFATGTDLGAISLWNTRRKKPVCTVPSAHSGNIPIGALSAYPFTDLLSSGSGDGFLRLWRAAPSSNELVCLREIPLNGFINAVSWDETGKLLAVTTGREQRLGRWQSQKSAKNQLHIFFFKK